MFLKPTPQLLQQIKDSGVPIIQMSMEEFHKLSLNGKVLDHNDIKINSIVNNKKEESVKILPPFKVIVQESLGKGLGVFATEKIFKGDLIETCHLISLNITKESNVLDDYRFNYPKILPQESVIPLGFGCIYNHSDNPNADWFDHPQWKAFNFVALKDIEPGEEICTYYGGKEYWNLRQHTKLI